MNLLIENAAQVVTCKPRNWRFSAGKAQSKIGLKRNTSILINDGIIKFIDKKIPPEFIKKTYRKIDARNKVVMPGFIDSHTHLLFAGDRTNEFSMRIKGKTYEQISAAGGGITKTVAAVRRTTKGELKEKALKSIDRFIQFGVTSLEAKSGYGLNFRNEIKMLKILNELKSECPINIFPTFLGAHAVPPEESKKDYIDLILGEMIPFVAFGGFAKFIDVFCERNYFLAKEADTILKQGVSFGLLPKLHTNQFNSIGGIEIAVDNKAISVDHLESLTKNEIQLLKGKGIVACLLPGVSYFLNIPYAPARALIDNSIPVALSTDFNPGSCMTENIQMIMSLAVHKMKMSIEETINAVTINAAAALGISDQCGSIEPGKKADMVIFDMSDYRHLIYHFGVNLVEKVIKNGKVIFES